jgi:hypothetical protein
MGNDGPSSKHKCYTMNSGGIDQAIKIIMVSHLKKNRFELPLLFSSHFYYTFLHHRIFFSRWNEWPLALALIYD